MGDRLRSMIQSIWALVILASLGSAQERFISSSNDTSLIRNATDLKLTLTMTSGVHYNLEPLTQSALRLSQAIGAAPLMIAKPENKAQGLRTGAIAYLTCESEPWAAADLEVDSAFNFVAGRSPSAIILFSNVSNHCNFTEAGSTGFSMVYTMTSADSSRMLESRLLQNEPGSSVTATIANITMVQGGSPTADPSAGTSPFGPQPTTHIAMIILYSITGVITALFLTIIVTGAIRAHRHPEQYGPRNAFLGRPRQSRAKGIARAMLDTIPIQKFGVKDGDKSTTDVELGTTSPEGQQSAKSESSTTRNIEASHDAAAPAKPDSAAEAITASKPEGEGSDAAVPGANVERKQDEGLSCSICTEDFVIGEDIRVLPCDHKYHPVCIDPWLLNVSGTCPLCRVDLRPTGDAAEASSPTGPSSPLPPPLAVADGASPPAAASRNRISRYIELRRMGREERLSALRTMREEQDVNNNINNSDARRRSAFNIFRINTRPMAAPTASR